MAMVIVLIFGCIGLAIIAFKVIKIKVSRVSVAVTVLMGSFLIGGILVAWKFSAPITDQTTLVRKITNLIADPESKELITKIYAEESQPLKKGDPIWEVDSRPNQYALNQAIAQVAANEQDELKAEAGIEVAAARVEEAKANRALTKAQLDTALKTRDLNPGAVAKLNVEVAQQTYQASDAAVSNAIANQKVSEFALTTARNNLKARQAQLELAKLNLSQNVKRAPSDGYLMNFQTVEGTMTTPLVAQSQGIFLNTSVPGVIAAIYPQNLLKNVEPGNSVEIAFKSLPGEIATGKVDAILAWTGEGQIQREKSTVVPIVKDLKARGFLAVRITIDDLELANSLPLGAASSVAIYTNTLKPFHIISKISIRIKMWMNYLPI
jgi:multidrug resistance efflux pump